MRHDFSLEVNYRAMPFSHMPEMQKIIAVVKTIQFTWIVFLCTIERERWKQLIAVVCVSRHEAACQNKMTGIYLSDLNTERPASFYPTSAYILFSFYYYLFFSRALLWDQRCPTDVVRRVSVFYVSMCFGRVSDFC